MISRHGYEADLVPHLSRLRSRFRAILASRDLSPTLVIRHQRQALEEYKYVHALRQGLDVMRLTWQHNVSWKGLELMMPFHFASGH